jgi:hypothetical protein
LVASALPLATPSAARSSWKANSEGGATGSTSADFSVGAGAWLTRAGAASSATLGASWVGSFIWGNTKNAPTMAAVPAATNPIAGPRRNLRTRPSQDAPSLSAAAWRA